MKKFVIILVAIVALIAIGISTVFYMTSGMTDTATAFFTDVKAKNYSKAYGYLSEEFKSNTPQKELIKFLGKSALLNFKETSWGTRSISGGKGTLDGTVITDSGGVIPIKLGFIKENDSWKIYSIYKPRAGLSQDDPTGRIPTNDELIDLTNKSMFKFAESINAKDFSTFLSHISNLWRRQTTVEELGEVFKPFIDAKINLVPALKVTNPSFDKKPFIDENGVLILEGKYPTKPFQIKFKLKYIFEGVNWKLIGTSVDI